MNVQRSIPAVQTALAASRKLTVCQAGSKVSNGVGCGLTAFGQQLEKADTKALGGGRRRRCVSEAYRGIGQFTP